MVNKYTYTSSKSMSDVSDIIGEPLTAWKNQAGGQVFNVIFDSGVYTNTYWVERWHVPEPSSKDGTPHNAWKYLRPATADEIKQHGNPTDGSVNPTEDIPSPVLQSDEITEKTYQRPEINFKPDGSGGNLAYTATRVCRPMYNEYETDKSKPKLSAYITDWCQYDARLDGHDEKADDRGRGFDLSTINVIAYDKLIFSFLGICGDVGVKKDKINEVWQGWKDQGGNITEGHIVPLDPYGDLGTARNVGLPEESANTDIGPGTFLPYYQQKRASGLLGGLRELQKTARLAGHKLELAFSIGGWSMSGYFSVMAADVALRSVFVGSIVDFFERFPMFSCVDIDWEYPGSAGEVGNVISDKDGENYALLIKELRESLDRRFGREERKEISIACSGVKAKLATSNIAELVKNGLDNIYLMSYDYFGTGWAPYIGHHTNLYSPKDPDPLAETDLSAEVAINYLHQDLGIPLEKIHLGYANYGRAGKGANLETREYNKAGDALGTMEKGSPEFFDIVNNYLDTEHTLATGKSGFVLMTDTNADADFLFSEKEGHFISLDTPRTVKQKAEYVAKNKLGGIFSWSGDQDCGLLANAAREGMGYIAKSNDETIDMGPLYNPGKPYYLKSIGEMKKSSD
ncbi:MULTISPECIES: glycosyl hydrolase family 18 protein [Photorhabdus]|uniref:chitinase n=2 Tax=Photorhabdus asymbiotica TaxID=291112 RepID=C7BJ83_PHOAA|nr:glycosyl hydrolase family 18 protein [Photorhabdus asymbiotica]RKS65952.1 chitinase [Photorhabdus asymbiotica]CAQ84151.1 similar to exochitinase [Photorhabdus asymbiotica]